MFRLSVPQPEMLRPDDLNSILAAMKRPEMSKVELRAISETVRERMNLHPASQKEENVPHLDGKPISGLQHKYRETVLFFPSEVNLIIYNHLANVVLTQIAGPARTVMRSVPTASDGRSLRL